MAQCFCPVFLVFTPSLRRIANFAMMLCCPCAFSRQGVTVKNTGMPHGLQTGGVDDVGFFNMRDDNVETYLMTLSA